MTSYFAGHFAILNILEEYRAKKGNDFRWKEFNQKLAAFADGIGPEKNLIVDRSSTKSNLIISDLVSDAHAVGLQVHPYTFRLDQGQVPQYADDFEDMLELFYFQADIDGAFTDFPDRAVGFLRNH